MSNDGVVYCVATRLNTINTLLYRTGRVSGIIICDVRVLGSRMC